MEKRVEVGDELEDYEGIYGWYEDKSQQSEKAKEDEQKE